MSDTRVGFGKSMHRFMHEKCNKPCIIGGVFIENSPGFLAETDGDVLIEALCFAIESLSSFRLYETSEQYGTKEGITESLFFLRQALEYIQEYEITSLAIVLEGKSPWLSNQTKLAIQEKVSIYCSIPFFRIGITQISCDGLNECGLGSGLCATVCLHIQKK